MSYDFKRVLALSPHGDDVELGAGGTIARWVEEGKEVFYATFSIAEKSLPKGLPEDTLEHEIKEAISVLGIAPDNLYIHRFEVRIFPQFRQEILELLVKLKENIKPELVVMPSLNDFHQDHHTIAEEGIRAFKHTSVICYEQPWNLLSFTPSCFVTLKKHHIGKKVKAIQSYQSQKHRNYTGEEFIHGLARTRGVQVNCEYAEAFEVVRWVMR